MFRSCCIEDFKLDVMVKLALAKVCGTERKIHKTLDENPPKGVTTKER